MCYRLFLTTLQLFWCVNAYAFFSFLERMRDNITASQPCQGVFWQIFLQIYKKPKVQIGLLLCRGEFVGWLVGRSLVLSQVVTDNERTANPQRNQAGQQPGSRPKGNGVGRREHKAYRV